MEAIGLARPGRVFQHSNPMSPRAYFDISQVLFWKLLAYIFKKACPAATVLQQWIAVVGKRKRHQPPSSNPTGHSTKNQAIGQVSPRRRRSVDDRLITIRPLQRKQPPWRVKYGRMGMSGDEAFPSPIDNRIDFVNHRSSLRTHSAIEICGCGNYRGIKKQQCRVKPGSDCRRIEHSDRLKVYQPLLFYLFFESAPYVPESSR